MKPLPSSTIFFNFVPDACFSTKLVVIGCKLKKKTGICNKKTGFLVIMIPIYGCMLAKIT